jgi:hypothetical protein
VAFTLTFVSTEKPPTIDVLAEWLAERGEPFVAEDGDEVALLAVPVRFRSAADGHSLQAEVDVAPNVSLTRLVDTVHDVSLRSGADLDLAGTGVVTRAQLWILLADEQDRLRIATALRTARQSAVADDVHRRLWAMIASIRPGHDDRWDTLTERVVEVQEAAPGVAQDGAQSPPSPADGGPTLQVPVGGFVHCLVWRWLSEAYPRLVP